MTDMKWIQKSKEPKSLQEHRGLKGTNYDSYSSDIGLGEINPPTGLRKVLLEDQGFICAYCMRRIPHKFTEKGITKDDFKIEHWIHQKSQESIDNKLDITYSNILACCMGNEGQKNKLQTCDTKKKAKKITLTPLDNSHICTLKYAPDGSIHSTNITFEDEINKILNLNEDNLRRQREAIYKLVNNKVKEEYRKPNLTRVEKNKYLAEQIDWWSSKKDGKFSEFCMVAITFLESKIK
jgi:uncharacterized protein (TIGR02646 family)